MTTGDDGPRPEEIEQQFTRIVASKTFATQTKLRPLLERLGQDYFTGRARKDDYESILAAELFGRGAEWTSDDNIVRQAMRNLRDSLDEYYKGEGSRDQVAIGFPPRAGFGARCSYRVVANAEESVRRLAIEFSYTFPDSFQDSDPCNDILAELKTCVSQHPSYAPAYPLLAEVSLAIALCEPNAYPDSARLVLLAEEAVRSGMRLNGASWQLHVMAGAVRCCRFAWREAEAAFGEALRLAPEETRSHLWYAAFLMAVGRTEEARQSVQLRLKKPRRRVTRFIEPLFLYAERRFDDALALVWQESLDTDRDEPAEHNEHGLVFRLREWPAELLAACLYVAVNKPRAADIYAGAAIYHAGSYAPWGLPVLTGENLARTMGPHGRGHLSADELKNEYADNPVSLALAYMGERRFVEAIAELERACDIGQPLMVWLHLWPIFDPLREDERFKELIKRMNLPQRDLPPTGL